MASSSPEMPDETPDGASSEGGFSEAARPATKKAPRPPGKAPAGKDGIPTDPPTGCCFEYAQFGNGRAHLHAHFPSRRSHP